MIVGARCAAFVTAARAFLLADAALRIAGAFSALLIFSFLPAAELYGHERQLGEMIVEFPCELLSREYQESPRDHPTGGATQPDGDRQDGLRQFATDPRGILSQNLHQKNDSSRIAANDLNAVERCKHFSAHHRRDDDFIGYVTTVPPLEILKFLFVARCHIYFSPRCNRADASKARSNLDHVVADFEKAIQFDPKYADTHDNSRSSRPTWGRSHDSQKALGDFMKFFDPAPSDPDGLRAIQLVKNMRPPVLLRSANVQIDDAFAAKLDESELRFEPSHFGDFSVIPVRRNIQFAYDYALKHKTLPIELRLAIHRLGLDTSYQVMRGYAYASVANMADKKMGIGSGILVSKEYPAASVRAEFNADWGATAVVKVDPTFADYTHGTISLIARDGTKTIGYFVFLFSDDEHNFNEIVEVLNKVIYSLRFKER